MDPVTWLVAGLIAVTVAATVLAARFALAKPADDIDRRLRHTGAQSIEPSSTTKQHARAETWATLLRPLARLMHPGAEESSRVHAELVHAGFRTQYAVEVYFGAKLALAATLAGACIVLGEMRTPVPEHLHVFALVAGAVGFYAPSSWLRSRVATRQQALTRALPDTLDLVVASVEAGLGLEAAIARITDEIALSSPLLAAELRLTATEIQAGVARTQAFRRLAERTGVEELRSLSAMLIQAETFGTSIAKALRVHSSTLRTRRSHRAEERAATVSVKMMVPLILCILPALFAVIMGPAVVRITTTLLPVLGGGK